MRVIAESARADVEPRPLTMSSPSCNWSPSVYGCQVSMTTPARAETVDRMPAADAASAVSIRMSSIADDASRSTTSTAVMSPPALPIAPASRPSAPGRSGTLTRSKYSKRPPAAKCPEDSSERPGQGCATKMTVVFRSTRHRDERLAAVADRERVQAVLRRPHEVATNGRAVAGRRPVGWRRVRAIRIARRRQPARGEVQRRAVVLVDALDRVGTALYAPPDGVRRGRRNRAGAQVDCRRPAGEIIQSKHVGRDAHDAVFAEA